MLREDEGAVVVAGQLVEDGADEALGVDAVGAHVAHDHGDVDVVAAGRAAPAVVVGGHADHLVGQLGLARELGLGQGRHVDHAAAPGAVHVGLGAGGELGALHAYDGPSVVQSRSLALHGAGAGLDNGGQLGVEGVGEANVADEALLEECEGAHALCAVDDLVGDDKVHGLDMLLEGADGTEGDDAAHADVPQGGDVGARGHLMGRELVVGAVAREEGDGHAVVLEDLDRGRGVAPWRQGVDGRDGHVAIDLGEAGV